MILLTRLNGAAFAVNPDLVERAESTPDTVVTLVDGTKYVVQEPVEEIMERVRDFRASVVARSYLLERELAGETPPPHLAAAPPPDSAATVVPLHHRWEG
ncbi:MAG: flagellar FlbD family protein [Motilibacteraceae bacterium]